MLPVETPFKIYTGLDGQPLHNGSVYFGIANQNPITAPVTVYWDAAGTQPAFQPLPTVNGYIVRAGTPANVFCGVPYSELVKDSKGRQVFYARTSDDFSIASVVLTFITSLAASAGSSLIGFIQGLAGSVATTVQAVLRERVSVFRFLTAAQIADATSGAPTLDLSTPLNAAIATGKKLYWPEAIYLGNLTIPNTNRFDWQGDGSKKSIIKAFASTSPTVTNYFQDPDWCYSSISDMGILGAAIYPGPYFSVSFCMGSPLGYPTGYTAGMELVGRVVFTRVQFRGTSKGVYKPYGNIGNSFYACTWQWHDYGYYAKGVPTKTHAGTDYFDPACEMNACEIAAICVLDATPGTGDWKINGTIQFNRGFGVFMDFGVSNAFRPIQLNFWDEANGTAYTPTPLATVTIDTLAGPAVLAPKGKLIRGLRDYTSIGVAGLSNGIGTIAPNAPLGIWGNQRSALNLIGGGYAPSWTQVGFSDEGQEATAGAYIRSNLTTGTNRDIAFGTAGGNQLPLWLKDTGSVLIGTDAVIYGVPATGAHVLYGPSSTAGARILEISARFGAPTYFNSADAAGYNAAAAVFNIGKVNSNSRSINAGGTVNASGADYAEYMHKAPGCGSLVKGAIVGITANAELTDKWVDAVSFLVKSTDPSYVGGDTWGNEGSLGMARPKPALRSLDVIETRLVSDAIPASEDVAAVEAVYEHVVLKAGDTDAEWSAKEAAYVADLSAFEAIFEAARQHVDRIAFSGQVPVNVYGAVPGQFIVPVPSGDGIVGEAVTTPTFDQYMRAVGKVIAIEPDGRARIIVKVA